MIGPRIPRSWLEHLDDENWDVVATDEIESWVSQDTLKTCTSVEPVAESDYCQIGMTATVMGYVNAVYTLECGHRRQLLAACSEQTIPAGQRTSLPAHKDDWRRVCRRSCHPQRSAIF